MKPYDYKHLKGRRVQRIGGIHQDLRATIVGYEQVRHNKVGDTGSIPLFEIKFDGDETTYKYPDNSLQLSKPLMRLDKYMEATR